MQDSDTGIDTTFNVSINCVPALQCIAIIGCTDLNNMTNNFESTSQIIELTLQLKEKVGLFILQFLYHSSITIIYIVVL